MSADVLRRAASLMRELAGAADGTGSWDWRADDGSTYWAEMTRSGRYIQSWHPAVALAVAKAMDDVALAWELCDGWALDPDDHGIAFEETVDGGWLDVARAYLGESA